MLFAGFVLAPTLVIAGFHSATAKKPAAPAQLAPIVVAVEPAAAFKQRKTSAPAKPAPADPHSATAGEAAPQSDTAPADAGHSDFDGYTTFAINDFAPPAPSRASFSHGGPGSITVASNDAGTIAKFTRKPKPPAAGNSQPSGSDNAVNDDGIDESHPKPADQPTDSDQQHTGTNKPDEHYADNYPHDERPQASVPEPSSIALLVAGLIGLIVARRRA
jgi:hypothetical protein